MKGKALIGFAGLALAGVVLMVALVLTKTTEEKAFTNFLAQYNYNEPEVLSKEALKDGSKIYLWKDQNQQMAAVVLEKNFIGSWNATEQIGFVDMKSTKENNFIWVKLTKPISSIGNGVYLGFCKGRKPQSIEINEVKASQVESSDGAAWYCISDYKGEKLVMK